MRSHILRRDGAQASRPDPQRRPDRPPGSGKTSLTEALLFEAGVVNRLGRVDDGSTVADFEPDEQERGMSIGASVVSFEYSDRK